MHCTPQMVRGHSAGVAGPVKHVCVSSSHCTVRRSPKPTMLSLSFPFLDGQTLIIIDSKASIQLHWAPHIYHTDHIEKLLRYVMARFAAFSRGYRIHRMYFSPINEEKSRNNPHSHLITMLWNATHPLFLFLNLWKGGECGLECLDFREEGDCNLREGLEIWRPFSEWAEQVWWPMKRP